MRTSIRTFVGAALALLALSGCKKDFLDQDPTQLFTADQLKKASQWNESINEGYINGVLNTFFKDGQATPSRHDDFSQKAFDISSDLMSGDMELQGGKDMGGSSKPLDSSRTSEMLPSTIPSGASATVRSLWRIASSAQAPEMRLLPR